MWAGSARLLSGLMAWPAPFASLAERTPPPTHPPESQTPPLSSQSATTGRSWRCRAALPTPGLKMTRRTKRRGDDLTRSSAKESKSCETESLVSGHLCGDCNQDVWTGLCDGLKYILSRSVASITLCNGETTLFSFSGIAIGGEGCLTRFLTSASLARIHSDLMNKDYGDLKIEVRHEGNEVYNGFLDDSDLDDNFAVIEVFDFLDVHDVVRSALDILPLGEKLLAVGRGSSGQLMASIVNFSVDIRPSEEEGLHDKVWEGGPLFSFDGEFVGMNHYLTTRSAMFLPWGAISKHLKRFGTSSPKKLSLAQSKVSKIYRPIGEKRISHAEVHRDLVNQEKLDVDSNGYPKLPADMLGAGMVLVNTFEETFGDMFGEGVWSKLSEQAFNIDHTVVALASFIGEKRFFACTGFFIEWNGSMIVLTSASLVRNSGDGNEVVAGLQIEVSLRENRRQKGTLKHYNLHYNIALVSVEDYTDARPANTVVYWKGSEVAAVGRCFESGALMAKTGEIVSSSGALDCDFLVHSSCKITKAGIGGPLVTLDGDVIGMNFYDRKIGTPFLYWKVIRDILALFEKKRRILRIAEDDKETLNMWPVPMPCWRHPDCFEEYESDDEEKFVPRSGNLSYFGGKKVFLY